MWNKDNIDFKLCPPEPVDGSKSSVTTVLEIDEGLITPLPFERESDTDPLIR